METIKFDELIEDLIKKYDYSEIIDEKIKQETDKEKIIEIFKKYNLKEEVKTNLNQYLKLYFKKKIFIEIIKLETEKLELDNLNLCKFLDFLESYKNSDPFENTEKKLLEFIKNCKETRLNIFTNNLYLNIEKNEAN